MAADPSTRIESRALPSPIGQLVPRDGQRSVSHVGAGENAMPVNVLVVTKGHVFDYNSFFAMFDESERIRATAVEQPAAQVLLQPEHVQAYDAIFFYDMQAVVPGPDGRFPMPPPAYEAAIEAALDAGIGMVLANHATVQWPAWPLWREISGTSFMLHAGEVHGEQVPGSGYRGGGGEPHRNPTHSLRPVDPAHPVCAGLDDGFTITDELYLKTPGFERHPDIVPLFRSDYDFSTSNFNPPPYASPEEKAAWTHPKGSNLITWAKRTRNSPVVATDAGDGPPAFGDKGFRRMLENALCWVASDAARAWARKG